MRIRRYDRDYSRRWFLAHMARGVLAIGVLAPLWKVIAKEGDITPAYPDELLSIDEFSKGRFKSGDLITADNVDDVRELLEPMRYRQIKEMGRELRLVSTTTDITRLNPVPYIEATLRNRGRARFDEDGNVVTDDGKPWIGGNPFPEPASGLEVFAAHTLSWGRHDAVLYPAKQFSVWDDGRVRYEYDTIWVEMNMVARTAMDPKPYQPGYEDKLRLQSVIILSPREFEGTSFLNVWPYDHSEFPDLYGYVPQFRRVRQFPTDQRFEPIVPGAVGYLSDAWAAGDPLHTWGNYKIVGRGPFLAPVSDALNTDDTNWLRGTHGGPQGNTFYDSNVELIPDTIVVDAEPTRFPRAPISKKRVWFDARTLTPLAMESYDRRGDLFRSFDGGYGLYEKEGEAVRAAGYPYWSWGYAHAFNLQARHMGRLEQVKELQGGYTLEVNDQSMFDRYLTRRALHRFGG